MIDHFGLFGIPRNLHIDPEKLEARFHTLQKASHPDKFAGGTAAELLRAQDTAAAINEGYRTLRDPLKRLKYLLKLYGYQVEGRKAVPQSLLMSVMEAQEAIAELEFATDERDKSRLFETINSIREQFEGRMVELENERQELAARWDAFPRHESMPTTLSADEKAILESAITLLAERAYLETMRVSLLAAARGEFTVITH